MLNPSEQGWIPIGGRFTHETVTEKADLPVRAARETFTGRSAKSRPLAIAFAMASPLLSIGAWVFVAFPLTWLPAASPPPFPLCAPDVAAAAVINSRAQAVAITFTLRETTLAFLMSEPYPVRSR
ncbi:MAG: hypothetical protein WEB05_08170 [Solirubrobacterales bacterium]